MQDIDSCCKAAGLWPDAVLSGHAHLYQRFTRNVNGRQVPYIVAGSGGFAATAPLESAPPAGTVIGDHTMEVDPIIKFGYLTLTTDAKTLTISFKSAPRGGPVTQLDFVSLNLNNGVITAGGNGPNPSSGKPSTTGKSRQTKSPPKPTIRKR
jgi:hypothetical protein